MVVFLSIFASLKLCKHATPVKNSITFFCCTHVSNFYGQYYWFYILYSRMYAP